jgi:predicted nucleic acid-binding protein
VILLDTKVISEWMKSSPDPAVIAWLDRQRPSQIHFLEDLILINPWNGP